MDPLIYLVDDEPLVTRVMQRNLRKKGYRVEAFHDGNDLLDAAAQELPDAVITDIEMPLMGGRELCETLEANYPQRSFPIFVVTGAPDLVHREWSAKLDNLQFIEKPISMQRLLSALTEALTRAGQPI